MISLIRNTLQDLRSLYRKLLLFEFLYLLLTSLLFVPIIAFIFNRMLRAMGSSFLLNGDVYRIALSYKGLLGLSLIVLVTVVVLFVEYGVVLIIAQKHLFGVKVRLSDAVLTAVLALPRLASVGLIQLAMLFFFLIPFVDSPLANKFTGSLNIPLWLRASWQQSVLFPIIYALLAIGVVYLFLRWMFALHFILLEGKSTRRALASSLALTRSKRIRVLLQLLLFNLFLFAIGFSVLSAIAYIPSLIDSQALRSGVRQYFLTISGFLTYLFALLLMPINIIFITRLYYRLRLQRGVEARDRLRMYSWRLLHRWESRAAEMVGERTLRSLLLLIVAIYTTATVLLNVSFHHKLVYAKWNVAITSHRGDWAMPENSLPAVRAAIEKSVDAVEIDVQMTGDGVVVLHHDYTLKRVAGSSNAVHELSFEELTRLSLGQHPESGVPIRVPALEEVLAEAKDRAKLVIEIKPYGRMHELAERVVELVEIYEMEKDVYVQSFDYGVLQTVRHKNPDIKIGQILFLAAGNLNKLDVDFYTIKQTMLTDDFVREAHRQDREVWVWTVNQAESIKQVLTFDVDGIITDFPERVQRLLGVKEEPKANDAEERQSSR